LATRARFSLRPEGSFEFRVSGFELADAFLTENSKPETLNSKLETMFLAKVVGTVWSTKKTPDLEGIRFLVVHPYDLEKEPTRNIVIVADRLGAGTGEMVMCAFGKAARTAMGNQEMAIEAAVVGIVDRVDITDSVSEEMREAAVKLARDNGSR
jgi:ethanolamine utilization protein EutN